MRTGRPLKEITLSSDERLKLEQWARRPKSAQRLALRSRIVLACAAGLSNTRVAEQLRVTMPTVGKWRGRFLEDRLEGLVDEPRPGAPRSLQDRHVEEVITRTLESKPDAATHGKNWKKLVSVHVSVLRGFATGLPFDTGFARLTPV